MVFQDFEGFWHDFGVILKDFPCFSPPFEPFSPGFKPPTHRFEFAFRLQLQASRSGSLRRGLVLPLGLLIPLRGHGKRGRDQADGQKYAIKVVKYKGGAGGSGKREGERQVNIDN